MRTQRAAFDAVVRNKLATVDRRVPSAVVHKAQSQLKAGDRGGAYLTLYRELGDEQLLAQAQITTYSGVWGSSALTGNAFAKCAAGLRYQGTLDNFSSDIVQATLDAIRGTVAAGGTGRLNADQLQQIDREVWRARGMADLFPGNSQFVDVFLGHHDLRDGLQAVFSRGTLNAFKIGLLKMVPNAAFFDRFSLNLADQAGKRPAEYANNPDYTTHGGPDDRFITVFDNRTGFVEVFWDKHPRMGALRLPQLRNEPLAVGGRAQLERHKLYDFLGANLHA